MQIEKSSGGKFIKEFENKTWDLNFYILVDSALLAPFNMTKHQVCWFHDLHGETN